jgi:hypothetical protein
MLLQYESENKFFSDTNLLKNYIKVILNFDKIQNPKKTISLAGVILGYISEIETKCLV